MRDCNISQRFIFSLVFILVAIAFSNYCFFYWFDWENFDIRNLIMTIVICGFIIIVFGMLIGLRQFISTINTWKCIKNNMCIEADKIIDKTMVGDDRYYIHFEYNGKINTFNNIWKQAKINDQYYVIRVNKDEVKFYSTKKYILDDDLQTCLINYHKNSKKHEREIWEEE